LQLAVGVTDNSYSAASKGHRVADHQAARLNSVLPQRLGALVAQAGVKRRRAAAPLAVEAEGRGVLATAVHNGPQVGDSGAVSVLPVRAAVRPQLPTPPRHCAEPFLMSPMMRLTHARQ
jgi:hypothetical protein